MRTYKRKLILNKTQEQRLLSWVGVCRMVYNMSLEIKKAAYAANGSSVHRFELIKQLPALRAEFDWVEDVPAQTLQGAIERLDNAYKTFFRTCKQGGGFPKFANRKTYKSILFKRHVRVDGDYVVLEKIGKIRMFKDSKILGIPRTATIKVEPTGFFVYIVCKDVPRKFESESQAIGLDMGITQFCADSNGGLIENPRHFQRYEKRLRIENRSLARKKKGSVRWKKQAAKLARLHHTIGNVRKDFLHKESTKLAKANSEIYVEDLRIAEMVQNKNFSKAISDTGWGMFRTMLEYKTNVVRVPPQYTSQTCSECGNVDAENRKEQEFVCLKCGHTENADVNAAKNILSRGTAIARQREALACA